MIRIFIHFTFLVLLSFTARAQSHNTDHHNHNHKRNEIGISTGAIYSIDHSEWGYGVHAHYFRMLGDHSPWSVGGTVEQVWAEGDHFSVGAGVKYQLFDRLSLGVLPGVTLVKHNNHENYDHNHKSARKAIFDIHLELVYDLLYWKNIHLGPAIDYSWSNTDSHLMVGVHFA